MRVRTRLAELAERPKPTRDRKLGQYAHSGGWERLCTCGHTLGVHAAVKAGNERPCFSGDLGGPGCDCTLFTPKK